MLEQYVLGVDPGFKGGLTVVKAGAVPLITHYAPMPLKKGTTRSEIDSLALRNFFESLPPIALAAIEDVSAMPGQGVTSMFRFGFGAGLVTGMINYRQIKLIRVKPAVWKSALGLGKDKAGSLALLKTLFPAGNAGKMDLKHDGMAEAALIAYFAAKGILGALA